MYKEFVGDEEKRSKYLSLRCEPFLDSAGELWKLEGNGNFLTIRDVSSTTKFLWQWVYGILRYLVSLQIDSGSSQRIEVKEITKAEIVRTKANGKLKDYRRLTFLP